ncbi:hypothetical protein [Comamonas fluminis]|uniref:hypothetical protein n=1 Tax=Comamonas fluminis TaxID=2796366 RepID=UPI001C4544C2|nr:hypothetical protein [Comamonas fluminis]
MASIVDTSVKHAYSSMTGASVINGTAGSLNAALRAFLVTGWGTKAVDSAAITNGVCRLTFASGKSAAEIHAVIALSGASPAALNGEQRVTAVASGWVEFKTDLPDGPVTGSLSFKMPSLGWEEVFSKTNVSVFRPVDPRGTRPFIRIDDSNALFARVQMYESMTDVDTGTGIAPALAGGYYWHKRSAASATGVFWMLIGDSRGFYYVPVPYEASSAASAASYGAVANYVGDINSYRSGDAWCGCLTGSTGSSYAAREGCVFQGGDPNGRTLMRASHGIGSAVIYDKVAFGSTSATSGANSLMGAFPSRADNGLRLVDVLVMDGAIAAGPRGTMPGAYFCPQNDLVAGFGGNLKISPGTGAFVNQAVLSLAIGNPSSTTGNGVAFWAANTNWRQ